MRKLFLFTAILFGVSFTSNAQDMSDNALGIRIGGSLGLGTEVSFQHALGRSNRLEVDLGWKNNSKSDAFKLTGLYQWVWFLQGDFNWYAGLGAGAGAYSVEIQKQEKNETGSFFYAAAVVGVEYNFEGPFMISLDFRPEFNTGDETYKNNGIDVDLALGIRYQF